MEDEAGVLLAQPPIGDHFVFSSEHDGWLAGEDDGNGLYVTHDGGKKWQQRSLKAPPQALPADYPTYHLPIFENLKRGYLPVTYSGQDGSSSALALFATDDGGYIWKPDREQSGLEERSAGQMVAATVVDSDLILAPRATGGKTLDLMKIPSRGRSSTLASPITGSGTVLVSQLSFVSNSTGWASTVTGLFSTTDGGIRWANITPGPAATAP
jgi:photosystem II stability/assembly factor-like uncharacterized protein